MALLTAGVGFSNLQTSVTCFHVYASSVKETHRRSFKPHPCFFPATILMMVSCTVALGLCPLALKSF